MYIFVVLRPGRNVDFASHRIDNLIYDSLQFSRNFLCSAFCNATMAIFCLLFPVCLGESKSEKFLHLFNENNHFIYLHVAENGELIFCENIERHSGFDA